MVNSRARENEEAAHFGGLDLVCSVGAAHQGLAPCLRTNFQTFTAGMGLTRENIGCAILSMK